MMSLSAGDRLRGALGAVRETGGSEEVFLSDIARSFIAENALSPAEAAARMSQTFVSADGAPLVSKSQIRRAVAEGFRSYRNDRGRMGEGDKVRLFSMNSASAPIPSTTDEHVSRLVTEVRQWGEMQAFGFGIWELDAAFGGLYPGETLALVGAPGSMKTALALSAVDDFLSKQEGTVLFFSLDMPAQKIAARRLMRAMGCTEADLYALIKRGDARYREAQRFLNERDRGRFKLIGRQSAGYTWQEMNDIIIQLAPDLVIVDYLTLIGSYKSDLLCVADVIPQIKETADNFGIAMILLSQMGRQSRADQKGASGGHAAGGHYVEDAVDAEIELLKDVNAEGDTAIVATVTKSRKTESGRSFRLHVDTKTLSFGATADPTSRAKRAPSIFEM